MVIVDNEENKLQAFHLANNNRGTVVRLTSRVYPYDDTHLFTWDDLLGAEMIEKGQCLRVPDGREVSFFRLAPLSFA